MQYDEHKNIYRERCTQCARDQYTTANLDTPTPCASCGMLYCSDCRSGGCPMCAAIASTREASA
jgi:hypothetical protein